MKKKLKCLVLFYLLNIMCVGIVHASGNITQIYHDGNTFYGIGFANVPNPGPTNIRGVNGGKDTSCIGNGGGIFDASGNRISGLGTTGAYNSLSTKLDDRNSSLLSGTQAFKPVTINNDQKPVMIKMTICNQRLGILNDENGYTPTDPETPITPTTPKVTCNLSSGQLNFDFGQVSIVDINNLTLEKDISITCSAETTVHFLFANNMATATIIFGKDGKMVAGIGGELTVPDAVNIKKQSTVKVTAKLNSSGLNKYGVFSASDVLKISWD